MANPKPIVFLVVAAAAGAGVWWTLRTPPEDAPKPPPPTAEKPADPKPSTAPVMTVPYLPEPEAKVPAERRLKMPDGSFVPTLNGVVNPAAIVWHSGPYSPVVRKQVDPTLEWYVHADGTYTTTIMQWRSDLGRNDACTLCMKPEKAATTEPAGDEGAPKKQ